MAERAFSLVTILGYWATKKCPGYWSAKEVSSVWSLDGKKIKVVIACEYWALFTCVTNMTQVKGRCGFNHLVAVPICSQHFGTTYTMDILGEYCWATGIIWIGITIYLLQ